MSDPFSTLSDEQFEVVYGRKGRYVVRACPGSGKTFSVSALLASKLTNWTYEHRGIAALSFTNVAWQQVESQLLKRFDMRVPVSYPHFLGTIDSFVNNLVFLPFGHLVMKCTRRPELVGPPHGEWTGRGYMQQQFANIAFTRSGDAVLIDRLQVKGNLWAKKKRDFVNVKRSLNRAGYATQSDANYYGMKVLAAYPLVAKALAHRFHWLIVDEAQDTSEIQMCIFDALMEAGLGNVVLIGDPDQAIFEWHDARPDIFNQKHADWERNSLTLTKNRRSSQKICNFTYPLSSLPAASEAVLEEVRTFPCEPEIVSYEHTELRQIIERFLSRCTECAIDVNPSTVAVLYRSRGVLFEIVNLPEKRIGVGPWRQGDQLTPGLARARYLLDHRQPRTAFETAEKAILCHECGGYLSREDRTSVVERRGFTVHRKRIQYVLSSLAEATGEIGTWVDNSNKSLASLALDVVLSVSRNKRSMTFDEVFASSYEELLRSNYRMGTIHSVKGETFEAALVILKQRAGTKQFYRTLLRQGISTSECEELRIVYVGLTRPRKVLVLAVPTDEDQEAWAFKLLGRGSDTQDVQQG